MTETFSEHGLFRSIHMSSRAFHMKIIPDIPAWLSGVVGRKCDSNASESPAIDHWRSGVRYRQEVALSVHGVTPALGHSTWKCVHRSDAVLDATSSNPKIHKFSSLSRLHISGEKCRNPNQNVNLKLSAAWLTLPNNEAVSSDSVKQVLVLLITQRVVTSYGLCSVQTKFLNRALRCLVTRG